jgi:hypothetical protein
MAKDVQTFEEAVEEMADRSKRLLDGREGIENGVFVEIRGNAGPRFTRELRKALTERNFTIADERDGRYVIDGVYAMGRVEGIAGITTKIVLDYRGPGLESITDQQSITVFTPEPLTPKTTQEIGEVHAVAAADLTAASLETTATQIKAQNGNPSTTPLDAEVRSSVLKEALENPAKHPPQIHGSVARFGEGSPYGIELLKESKEPGKYVTCALKMDDNARTPYVELQRGDRFAIVIRNDSGHPVAVALSLDGINHFEFSTQVEFKTLGKIIVRRESGFVQGWYIDEQELRKFEIMNWGQAAAGQLGRTSDVGMITATFFQTTNTGKASSPAVPATDAIGVGDSIKNEGTITRATIAEPLGIVSIRYKMGEPDDLPH